MKTKLSDKLTYAEHASEIIGLGAVHVRASRPFALITSLDIKGGAAREVGSLALVDSEGAMTGYLSNGCIDRDIKLHAEEALQSGRRKLIRYGDGSRFADLKLPCGGALTVLIDPQPDWRQIMAAASDFAARKPATLSFQADDACGAELSRTFTYPPRTRLVLAGRGAIFRSTAQIGHAIRHDLHLLSPDTEDLSAVGHLSAVPPIHLTTPGKADRLPMLDAYAAFLTLFHDHEWEPELLRLALDTPARFIGSLGSRRTHEMRRESLRQMGVPEGSLARLRGPIGLVPSLRDASTIAVSAIAEVVATFQTIGSHP